MDKVWRRFLKKMEAADELISASWLKNEPWFQADYRRQLASDISMAYFLYFQADPDHPDWTPLFNQVHLPQPNPDDTYYWSPMRGDGVYRVYGYRGNVHKLIFSMSCGLIGMAYPPGPPLGVHDINALEVGSDGFFEIVFSKARPEGHTGNWAQLDERVEYIIVRQRHYDWANETGARLGIEALHPTALKPRMSIADIDRNLSELALFPERLSKLFFEYHNNLRTKGVVNKAAPSDFSEMGGLMKKQVYWQGIFEFGAGEALILESDIPETVDYWNIQLNDMLFNVLEFVYRQSHLNGHMAHVSSDGKFRAVISVEDPGVPNWLDSVGHYEGVFVGRWMDTSSAPMPTVRRVKLSEVRGLMPSDTPVVTPEQRAEVLRKRVMGHQFRRRW